MNFIFIFWLFAPVCLHLQSLDYEICDNELYQNDIKFRESHFGFHKDVARWILFILIGILMNWIPLWANISTGHFSFDLGILTALVACFIDIIIDQISTHKYSFLKHGEFFIWFPALNLYSLINNHITEVDENVLNGNLYVPYLYYALLSAIPVALGSILVTYIEVTTSLFNQFVCSCVKMCSVLYSQSQLAVEYHWSNVIWTESKCHEWLELKHWSWKFLVLSYLLPGRWPVEKKDQWFM